MKKTVGDSMMIKASGGIRDYKTAKSMIEAGADRLGASSSVSIMKESENK
jgi:deoxyribose-phosphate aldolase